MSLGPNLAIEAGQRQGSAGVRAAACAPIHEMRQRSPSAPPRSSGMGGSFAPVELGDDWEDDVDDLLNWTNELPEAM